MRSPTPIRRSSLADQAAQAIVELIGDRGLRDGDSLPATNELADSLDVSVPVIREAVAGLAAIGLLRRHQGRETTVSMPDSTHLTRILALRVSGAEIVDDRVQQFREIVEVGNARLAATNRSPADLTALSAAMHRMRSVASTEDLHAADVDFHSAIARATSNNLCELTLDALEPMLRRLRRRAWAGWVTGGGRLDTIVEAHATILTAIHAGDPGAAATAMTAHLAQARVGLNSPSQ